MPSVRAYEESENQRRVTDYVHDAEAMGGENACKVSLAHVRIAWPF